MRLAEALAQQERAPLAGLCPCHRAAPRRGGGMWWVTGVTAAAHRGARALLGTSPLRAGRKDAGAVSPSPRLTGGCSQRAGGGSFSLTWLRNGKGGVIILFWFILGTSGPSLQGTRFQVLNSSSFSERGRWIAGGREGGRDAKHSSRSSIC